MKNVINIARRSLNIFAAACMSVGFLLLVMVITGCDEQVQVDKTDRVIYFDGHIHTTYSDGTGCVADIKKTAISRGLDAVIITDHSTHLTRQEWTSLLADARAATDENFLALPAFELTGQEGLFCRDHFLAWAVDTPFIDKDGKSLTPEQMWPSPHNDKGTGPLYPENLAKWTEYVHSKNGIAVHAHPAGTTQPEYNVNFVEIYNYCNRREYTAHMKGTGLTDEDAEKYGQMMEYLTINGDRDLNISTKLPGSDKSETIRNAIHKASEEMSGSGQWLGEPEGTKMRSWDELLIGYVSGSIKDPIFCVANTDTHNTASSNSNVGKAKNGVYVNKLTADQLYAGLRAGRCFATTGPSLMFEVNDKQMGQTTIIDNGIAELKLDLDSENDKFVLTNVNIIKNGILWQSLAPMTRTCKITLKDDNVSKNTYWRLEVTSCNENKTQYQQAWSNPVFARIK